MIALMYILITIAIIAVVLPFVVLSWTNFNKAQEIFGILRLKFISLTFLISYSILVIDIILITLIAIL